MKKSALNLLWQQKRNELSIDENPQTDWAEMDKLLNVQMPVNTGAMAAQSVFKTMLAHIARYKLLLTLAGLLTCGTIAYFLPDHKITVQKRHHDPRDLKAKNDNDLQNSPANNLALTDSIVNKSASDDSHIAANGDKKASNNKNKASLPTNSTNTGSNNKTGGNLTAEITHNDNPLPPVSNSKLNVVKRTVPNHNGPPLPANNSLKGNLSGGKLVLTPAHSNNNRLLSGRINFHNSASRLAGRNESEGDVPKTGRGEPGNDTPAAGLPNYPQQQKKGDIVQLWPSQLFSWDTNNLLTKNANSKLKGKVIHDATDMPLSAKIKNKKSWTLPIDWGLLAGINTPGSFTSANKKATNGVPFDVYSGLFASYNLNDKWSVNLQARLPSPHLARGNYSHTEEGKTDTTGTHTVNSRIIDSRKMYMVDIPLHLVYRVSPNIGIKGGAVLSIPLTDANGISTVTTSGTLKDSVAYFNKMSEALNNTRMERKIYYGVSGGVSLNYGRLLLDATLYHNFQAQKVSSSLGGYTSDNNSLQITVGFRLNKKRQ